MWDIIGNIMSSILYIALIIIFILTVALRDLSKNTKKDYVLKGEHIEIYTEDVIVSKDNSIPNTDLYNVEVHYLLPKGSCFINENGYFYITTEEKGKIVIDYLEKKITNNKEIYYSFINSISFEQELINKENLFKTRMEFGTFKVTVTSMEEAIKFKKFMSEEIDCYFTHMDSPWYKILKVLKEKDFDC